MTRAVESRPKVARRDRASSRESGPGAPAHRVGITKVGLWYVLFAVIVGIAATNTGNNALYLVIATMSGLLVVCWLGSRVNGSRIDVTVDVPAEVFAGAPESFEIAVRQLGRFVARRQLVVRAAALGPWVIHRLTPRPRASSSRTTANGASSGGGGFDATVARRRIDLTFERRGRHQLPTVEVLSLFPLGLFRSARASGPSGEVVVYPRLLPQPVIRFRKPGELGADSTRRGGWGHDLHALRPFRSGDDPRSIHWKQSARSGELVFKEHEAEESRRLAIVLDEGMLDDDLLDEPNAEFEHLVSQAATAGLDYLDRGFEVELVTRTRRIPFAAGPRQRTELLASLALIAPCAPGQRRLESSDRTAPELRLVMHEPVALPGSSSRWAGSPPRPSAANAEAVAAPAPADTVAGSAAARSSGALQ